MQFPTPHIRRLHLSSSRSSFLQNTAPSFWSPLIHKAHPSTSIAYHFDKHLISIPIFLLLLTPASLQARAPSSWPSRRLSSSFVQIREGTAIFSSKTETRGKKMTSIANIRADSSALAARQPWAPLPRTPAPERRT